MKKQHSKSKNPKMISNSNLLTFSISRWALFVSAFGLSVTVAFFSVSGLAAIFGASAGIFAMGALMEIGKLASIAALHLHWKNIGGAKWMLSGLVGVLMLITSLGVFGYLGRAFETTSGAKDAQSQSKIAVIDAQLAGVAVKLQNLQSTIGQYDALIGNSRKGHLEAQGSTISRRQAKILEMEDRRLQSLLGSKDSILGVIPRLIDEQTRLTARKSTLEASQSELGMMRFIAVSLGGDGRNVATWMIFALVLCLDPLAVLMMSGFLKIRKRSEVSNGSDDEGDKSPNDDKPVIDSVASSVVGTKIENNSDDERVHDIDSFNEFEKPATMPDIARYKTKSVEKDALTTNEATFGDIVESSKLPDIARYEDKVFKTHNNENNENEKWPVIIEREVMLDDNTNDKSESSIMSDDSVIAQIYAENVRNGTDSIANSKANNEVNSKAENPIESATKKRKVPQAYGIPTKLIDNKGKN